MAIVAVVALVAFVVIVFVAKVLIEVVGFVFNVLAVLFGLGLVVGLIWLVVHAAERWPRNQGTAHAQALIGCKAIALSAVDRNGGQVKLSGDVWTARSFDDKQVIEPGTAVTVVEISGKTAIVLPELP